MAGLEIPLRAAPTRTPIISDGLNGSWPSCGVADLSGAEGTGGGLISGDMVCSLLGAIPRKTHLWGPAYWKTCGHLPRYRPSGFYTSQNASFGAASAAISTIRLLYLARWEIESIRFSSWPHRGVRVRTNGFWDSNIPRSHYRPQGGHSPVSNAFKL